jgi:hypothetical protein
LIRGINDWEGAAYSETQISAETLHNTDEFRRMSLRLTGDLSGCSRNILRDSTDETLVIPCTIPTHPRQDHRALGIYGHREVNDTMKRLSVILLIILSLIGANFALAEKAQDASQESSAYSGSAHRIVDTYTLPGVKVIQSTLPVLSVYSYMLISDGDALVVDPVRDISFYLETAKKEGATIKGVYLSHSHADFVAGPY